MRLADIDRVTAQSGYGLPSIEEITQPEDRFGKSQDSHASSPVPQEQSSDGRFGKSDHFHEFSPGLHTSSPIETGTMIPGMRKRGNIFDNYLEGTGGDDNILGYAGDDTILGQGGNDGIGGGWGNDLIDGGAGIDAIEGDSGDDTIFAGQGHDLAIGGSGNDRLFGDAGNDLLVGLGGRDILDGGDGDDQLAGGAGFDQLTGGTGRDTFIFGSFDDKASNSFNMSNLDRITDFKDGEDRVWLSGAMFGDLDPNNIHFTTGSEAVGGGAQVIYNPNTGVLYYDADGAGGASAQAFAEIGRGHDLSADDFFVSRDPDQNA